MFLECISCEGKVQANEVAKYNKTVFEEDLSEWEEEAGEDGRIPLYTDTFILFKCSQCEEPILTLDRHYSEEVDAEPMERLYPPMDNKDSPQIPESIRKSLHEARLCYKNKTYIAATAMCRKALQGVCEEYGIKTGNMDSRLKQLREKGIIEKRLYAWADALRILGNEAIHEMNTMVGGEDARDALEFTGTLLEYVFTFERKFEQFKKRLEARKNIPEIATPTPEELEAIDRLLKD